MFTADLSWAGPEAEKVGEHRERKNRARDGSVQSRESDGSSSAGTRASFWSLKKSKSISMSASSSTTRKPSRLSLRDPTKDPAYHHHAPWNQHPHSPPPALPSARPLDHVSFAEPPTPRASCALYRNDSIGVSGVLPPVLSPMPPPILSPIYDSPHPQPLSSNAVTIDEVTEVQRLSPDSYVFKTTTTSVEPNALSPINILTIEEEKPSSCDSPRNSSCTNSPREEDLVFSEGQGSSTTSASSQSFHHRRNSTAPSDPNKWKPPTDWDVCPSSPSKENTDTSQLEDLFPSDPDPSELTEFQRFIRRMESAGPRIILGRLKEETPDDAAVDSDALQEMELERHLWVLTALQLQSMEQAAVPTQGVGPLIGLPTLFRQPKRVLELYSNLADVYQLSAIYPKSRVSYLTTKPLTNHPLPLPNNVTPLTVPSANILPLPYSPSSFNHIRASSLPAHLAASDLPALLRDCFRLLAPGGILELRLVDATPRPATMGPLLRAWFEERVLLGLELGFRCSRPTSLMSAWVRKAGFSLLGDRRHGGLAQRLRLPAVFARGEDDDGNEEKVDGELRSLVARGLWKDVWGGFARTDEKGGGALEADGESVVAGMAEADRSTPPCWWWEDEEIVRECWEYGTTVECGTLFAFKE
ncbi:hypothetical protein K490DRAFT_65305 [Saccharata proteae CBS 121410]|uniref:Methyltransferase type 11 domain-containing protein n=1 Tax=Saccharata proteae CBS 121410 TaxID=1314787 RepID=A0A9P4HZE8_9PEZI|nr:hypothetical protein K490DRAFT_65305 [Saccharata proteae CBS 121410]